MRQGRQVTGLLIVSHKANSTLGGGGRAFWNWRGFRSGVSRGPKTGSSWICTDCHPSVVLANSIWMHAAVKLVRV